MTEGDLARLGIQPDGNFIGRVGVRRGAIIGYGAVFWDGKVSEENPALACWGPLSSGVRPTAKDPVEKRMYLARLMKDFTEGLPPEITAVAAICDHRVPRAEQALRWLGYEPTADVAGGFEVWLLKRS